MRTNSELRKLMADCEKISVTVDEYLALAKEEFADWIDLETEQDRLAYEAARAAFKDRFIFI